MLQLLRSLLCLLIISGCDSQNATDTTSDSKPALTFKPATTLQQTMEWVLDPAADLIWASAGAIITEEGTEDLAPTTDEAWDHVRNNAAIVAETGNLLMMPSHALGEHDWMELSRGLVDAGLLALSAAEAKDADALFTAGGQIYNVCRACHQQYMIKE